ncbi:MAG: hypothetical protein Kow0069_02060 [Promethearchaeota archaeon]
MSSGSSFSLEEFKQVEKLLKSLDFSDEEIDDFAQKIERKLGHDPVYRELLQKIQELLANQEGNLSYVEILEFIKSILKENKIQPEDLEAFSTLLHRERDLVEDIQERALEKFLEL